MSTRPSVQVTQMLVAWSEGDEDARGRLWPIVYSELRSLAAGYLRSERGGHTLQTTDLVHEAYLRLIEQDRVRWQNRAHFFGIAAQIMRRLLLDHARKHLAAKRGSGKRVPLDEAPALLQQRAPEWIDLDEALTSLEVFAPRQARIVELRFFGGLTAKEIGHVLGISAPTVTREWRVARAWLYEHLQAGEPHDA